MKFKVGCIGTIAASMFFGSTYGGALKKQFAKEGQEAIKVEGQQPKADEAPATDEPATPAADTTSTTAAAAPEAAPEAAAVPGERKKIVGDPVVLRINGKKEYRRSQILADMKLIPPQMIQGLSPDKLFEMLRDQKSSTYLMVEQAKKAGMDRTPEFLEKVEQLKDDLLGRMFLMRELAPKAENEAALKARYNKYLVEFKKGKEFQVFHIMVATEVEAKDILVALEKGEDFKRLAKEKSLAPSKSKEGEEGYIPVDLMPVQIKDKVLLLKSGEHTKEFVKTDNGFHIFKVGEIRDTTPQKYEEALPMLKQVVMHEEMTKLIERLEKQANVERFHEDGTAVAPKKDRPISAL